MTIYPYLALMLSFGGSVCVYLASRHQLWLNKVWPAPYLRYIGLILLGISLVLVITTMQLVAGVFMLLVWVMLLLVLFPYIGAWKSLRRAR
ncbi:MAG: hypothetical protein CMH22_18075 [Methylophaga sp.]|uniref:hypothetical protein n=1 Tax=Methylophaga sp. UBA678 TaxID=1946901 RepID=UPI000C5F5CAC|nr:hypothetical protein [Methylophaga sp. UBA678]MAX53888.1 hypothetical protein [Methylophaga sp.]|tara:strand:- start:50257 stop:50529 length:273 start_codon:yes stop_codon:yes gene_type:complete